MSFKTHYNNAYGFGAIYHPVNATDVDIAFSRYLSTPNSYDGVAGVNQWTVMVGQTTRWRLRKVSGGASVGFPIAAANVIGRIQTKSIGAEAYASSGGLGTLVTTLFNNLTIGNTYKVSGGIATRSDSGNTPISVKLACNGADVIGGSGYTFPTYPATGTDYTYPIAVTFTATGTTLSVYAFGSNNAARIRGGTLTIEEVSPNSITTAFT